MTDETSPAPEPGLMDGVPEFLRHWLPRLLAANGVLLGIVVVFAAIAGRSKAAHAEVMVGIPAVLLMLGLALQVCGGAVALFLSGVRVRGALAVVTAPAMWLGMIIAALMFGGMGWGRPLRVRGRQVYPQLAHGADWTQGDRPSVQGLDSATREALEALWLHDAQKEHASVPAFARISWLLAAVGAPAELMAWAQRAALEEIDHARRCFALAAGYGGRSHSVEPMPDLLLAGLDVKGDPLVLLAHESLQDGCQLEDFNADVAAACGAACREPVTRAVLEQIAREERSHAEFSWALLAWTLERNPEAVRAKIAETARELEKFPRPRAAGPNTWPKVARADPQLLLAHGRIADHQVAQLWEMRLAKTRERLEMLLGCAHPSLREAA